MRSITLFCLVTAFCVATNSHAQSKPLVISEILFNPSKDGYDFVEFFNTAEHAIDLNGYLIANRNSIGEIGSIKRITRNSLVVPSYKHVVITPKEEWLRATYSVPDSAIVLQIASMPSFPDDEGTILIMRASDSSIIDELRYSDEWHFSLLDEKAGVSLERISHEAPTQDSSNWASAASPAGYGTPGYTNSQQRTELDSRHKLVASPKVFTPDNDGTDDYLFVKVNAETGFVANSIVYDASGRRVKYLIRNAILGNSNVFRWDGTDDLSRPASPGAYILATTIFNPSGKVTRFKNLVVIARGPR